MNYTIVWDPDGTDRGGINWSYVPCFHVHQGSELVATVWGVMTLPARVHAVHVLRLGNQPGDDQPLREIFKLYTLRRLESELAEPSQRRALIGSQGATWQITGNEIDEVISGFGSKDCSYQVRERRDYFCTAASPDDEFAVALPKGVVSPTSRPVCARCDLPDTSWMCSHLLHPQVIGIGAAEGLYLRQTASALCDLGHDDRVRSVRECRPGGHDCWQRFFTPAAEQSQTSPPLSLPEAFDFLDAVWRLGPGNRLIGHVAATHAAGLVPDRDDS
jgi:hypothetical protein